MTSLLKRLSIGRTRLDEPGVPSSAPPRALTSVASFSDFSMGTERDADDHLAAAVVTSAVAPPEPPSPSLLGTSAPAGYGFGGLAKSSALKIPRPSMAHILEQRLRANGGGEASTPRSSLDMPIGSAPSPAGPPLSPRAPPTPLSPPRPFPAARPGGDPSEPASPRSPRTPGGRRRKSGKIEGVDYYDFCELIRTSSL